MSYGLLRYARNDEHRARSAHVFYSRVRQRTGRNGTGTETGRDAKTGTLCK